MKTIKPNAKSNDSIRFRPGQAGLNIHAPVTAPAQPCLREDTGARGAEASEHLPSPASSAAPTAHTHGTRKVRHLLVVDDTAAIRESLAKVLGSEGYDVVLAASGFEAMNRYDPQEIDVVILDLGLPGIDGWTAFQGIMALNPQQAVIFISGQVSRPTWVADAYPGVFLPKPLDVPLLFRHLKEMVIEPSLKRCERTAVQTAFVRITKPFCGSSPDYSSPRHGGINE